MKISRKIKLFIIILLLFIVLIASMYKVYTYISIEVSSDIGIKIDKYARRFIGTKYDKIDIGAYVKNRVIIYDTEVDCMYLVFRVIELAVANGDEQKAINFALDNRFHTKGKLDADGKVMNYGERYQYSEDVIADGKFGKSIFTNNEMQEIQGERMHTKWFQLPIEDVINNAVIKNHNLNQTNERIFDRIETGDIVFFIRKKELREVGEIIAHLGILEKTKNGNVYVIHASGKKDPEWKDAGVIRVRLDKYLKQKKNKFSGVYITRF
ncbi:MAG: DUF1460 domain-containing protein [Rickettsiales bacterium]|nr:DUF1460 domain-containing protein [Rickettsiales bacterium]